MLRGVGAAIAQPNIRAKVLILNGSVDRETGPSKAPFSALDFVAAIADACVQSRGVGDKAKEEEYVRYVSHVVYLECPGAPKVDKVALKGLGIEAMRIYGWGGGRYDDYALQQCLEVVLGRGGDGKAGFVRRNTLER